MRSPLKELNGGSKVLLTLKSLIPAGAIINSFGFFDGAVELDLASNERFIIAHTNKYVIYEFWRTLFEDPRTIAKLAENLYPVKDNAIFNIFQENWPKYKDPFIRSALFFLLNRCSDNGMLSTGQMTNDNFNKLALVTLKNFSPRNLHLVFDTEKSLSASLSSITADQWILLPSLNFSFNLLEHGKIRAFETTPINHRQLKQTVATLDNKVTLVYRHHPQVFKLYKDYNITMIDKYGQETQTQDKCREIIVANF
jgi:hypothetical protein